MPEKSLLVFFTYTELAGVFKRALRFFADESNMIAKNSCMGKSEATRYRLEKHCFRIIQGLFCL